MESYNRAWFLWMNASAHPALSEVYAAVFFAEAVILLIPAILVLGWMRRGESIRKVLLEASVAGMGGLIINQLIALMWQHPRPFVVGLGHTLIHHAADSSFPSDHLTLIWAVALSFTWHPPMRRMGVWLVLLGLPVAWARIFLGVHYPFDMIGALGVAWLAAWLAYASAPWYIPTIFKWAMLTHHHIFRMINVRKP